MKYVSIAVRNLNRQKKRSVLLGGAIALGIAVITLVNGFTAGAVANVKDNFSYLLAGHVYISEQSRRDDDTRISLFQHPEDVQRVLDSIGIRPEQVVRRSAFGATFLFNGRSVSQTVQGVLWDDEPALVNRLNLTEGSVEQTIQDPRGLIMSHSAAQQLGIEIGEEVDVRLTTVTGQQNAGTFVVQGFMADPGILGSLSSYGHLSQINSLINIPETSFQSLNITLDSMNQVNPLTNQIYSELEAIAQVAPRDTESSGVQLSTAMEFTYSSEPEEPWSGYRFEISNINDFTAEIESLSALVNSIGIGILMVLIVITLVGVANTFRMIMYERVKEIGTMRAIGMQRGIIRRIFLYEAMSLASLGYVAGVILAIIGGILIGFFNIPSENAFSLFTNSGQLTFPLQVSTMIGNYVLITVLTTLAALVPANKAAKLLPADSLRAA